MLTGADPSLDGPVILLQNVVKIPDRSVPTAFVQIAFGFELHDRRRVRAVTVGVDDARRRMAPPSKRFGSGSALLRPRKTTLRDYLKKIEAQYGQDTTGPHLCYSQVRHRNF